MSNDFDFAAQLADSVAVPRKASLTNKRISHSLVLPSVYLDFFLYLGKGNVTQGIRTAAERFPRDEFNRFSAVYDEEEFEKVRVRIKQMKKLKTLWSNPRKYGVLPEPTHDVLATFATAFTSCDVNNPDNMAKRKQMVADVLRETGLTRAELSFHLGLYDLVSLHAEYRLDVLDEHGHKLIVMCDDVTEVVDDEE